MPRSVPQNDLLMNKSHFLLRFSLAELMVLCFTVLYMAIALCAAIRFNNSEFVMYLGVISGLIIVVVVLHLRVRLHIGALAGLSLWGLAHMIGGLLRVPASWPVQGDAAVVYNWWIIPDLLKFDHIVHAFGFGLVTCICWQALSTVMRRQSDDVKPTFGLLILCVAGGMGFGALNEVVEFLAVLTLPRTNVGGYENTGWDLVANLVGCILAAVFIATGVGKKARKTSQHQRSAIVQNDL